MKLLEKDITLNQSGSVKVIAEDPDDLWLLYNLISSGDTVTADTTRKVHLQSSTKSTAASRVKLTLHLKVTRRDFHKDSSTLRIHGRNLEPNQYVSAGSFHTFTLETNNPFELHKKLWNPQAIEILNESTKNLTCSSDSSNADIVVVPLQQNQAEIYLLTKGITTRCSKVEASPSSSHSQALRKASFNVFFREVFVDFVKCVDFNVVRSVVIASDNASRKRKGEFHKFLLSEARRLRMRWIEENKTCVVVVGPGCGDLRDVLGDVAVMNVIRESKVGLEIRVCKELWDMVCNGSDRVCYGPRVVESAQEMRAIETLLISDELYRSEETGVRLKYEGLVRAVKDGGGKALVYSSMHVSAPHLAQLTGVAAILRFPLPDLEDMEDVV
ncbi:protein PELOTA 1-like [Lotus japonicus]|uniref:protein PELOTA 1-like n=1 Tax=Lotus japonicus TaxID=34305 RepID=UPI0025878FE8|nr:protein PELOTA 1-like [Lotus japonicus]